MATNQENAESEITSTSSSDSESCETLHLAAVDRRTSSLENSKTDSLVLPRLFRHSSEPLPETQFGFEEDNQRSDCNESYRCPGPHLDGREDPAPISDVQKPSSPFLHHPPRHSRQSAIPSAHDTPLRRPMRGDPLMSPDSEIIEDSMIYQQDFSTPTRPSSMHPRRLPSPLQDTLDETKRRAPQRARALSNLLSFSLWEHLKHEIDTSDNEHLAELQKNSNQRSERVSNFLNVPISIEKMITIGLVICLDAFLSVFTILPIKFFFSLCRLFQNLMIRFSSVFCTKARPACLKISNKIALIQGLLVILVCVTLHHITDASRMYHLVRGQETIKLYVIFNVLEIADRLCCSFGQDILDSLFSPSTLSRRNDGSQPRVKPLFLFLLSFVFTVAHTLVLFYQLVSLNVAINSYDHSLITLLISNQFVEIKGSVFKKFEKENLFQMSCADIVERFQLSLMLNVIAFRNLIELWDSASTFPQSSSSFTPPSHAYSLTYQYLPSSFNIFPSLSLLQTIFLPPIIVILSEVIVDWLKHAFITKFNHIRPTVYGRYIDVLCKDLVGDKESHEPRKIKPFVDKSPAVSRRIGFSVFPICCLTVRVIFQAWDMISEVSYDDYDPQAAAHVVLPNPLSIALFNLQQGLARSSLTPTLFKRWLPLFPLDSTTKAAAAGISQSASSAFSSFQLNLLLSLSILTGLSFMILIKLFLGIWLRLYAEDRLKSLEDRVEEDVLNDKGRKPIGSSEAELKKEREDIRMMDQVDFDVPSAVVGGARAGDGSNGGGCVGTNGKEKGKIRMEELGRFDMVRSRIW